MKKPNKKTKPGIPVDSKFLEWLHAHRKFGVRFLKKNYPWLSWEEAEDLYSELCARYSRPGALRFELMVPGMIAFWLKRLVLDELDRRNTIKGGRDYTFVSTSIDYFESCGVPDLGSADRLKKAEQTEYALWLVGQAVPHLNKRERIVATVLKRWVLSGCAGRLGDEFTEEERMAFYYSSREKGLFDHVRFRDKLSKRLSDVIKVMREIAAKDSEGDWSSVA